MYKIISCKDRTLIVEPSLLLIFPIMFEFQPYNIYTYL